MRFEKIFKNKSEKPLDKHKELWYNISTVNELQNGG